MSDYYIEQAATLQPRLLWEGAPHIYQTEINYTLPETNSSNLKMDGWNRIVSFWGPAYFQVRFAVSFREGIFMMYSWSLLWTWLTHSTGPEYKDLPCRSLAGEW